MDFQVYTPTDLGWIDARNDGRQTFELINGESLEVGPSDAVVTQLTGTTASISTRTVTPGGVGLSTYSVARGGRVFRLRVMTCEVGCLTKISAAIAGQPGAMHGEPNVSKRQRLVLRSIVTEAPAWFTGTASSLDHRNLAHYGA